MPFLGTVLFVSPTPTTVPGPPLFVPLHCRLVVCFVLVQILSTCGDFLAIRQKLNILEVELLCTSFLLVVKCVFPHAQ